MSRERVVKLTWLVVLLIASGGLAVYQGQDASWDLLNYHLYNPFAWLEGRYDSDLAPAHFQTWFNPFLDVPFYWLATAPVSGIWPTLWLAFPAGIGLWLCLEILDLVTPPPPEPLARVACAVVAVTGAAAYPQLGTAFNEWPLGAAVLASLLLLLREFGTPSPRLPVVAAAGFVSGVAFGLKYSIAFNCLALAVVCGMAAPRGFRVRCIAALAAGGSVGALLTASYWIGFVYQQTGNPLYPFLNPLFDLPGLPTPDYAARSSVLEWIPAVAAWKLAVGVEGLGTPLYVRDPRMLIAGILSVGFFAALWRRRFEAGARYDRNLAILSLFFLTSFTLWNGTAPMLRFIVALECIAAVLLIAYVVRVPSLFFRTALALASIGFLLFVIERPNWGRVAFSTPFLHNVHPVLPEGSVIVTLTRAPLAYAAVGLPPDVPVYALSDEMIGPDRCTPELERALQQVARAPHVFVLQPRARPDARELDRGRAYGFTAPGACDRITSSLRAAWLCRLELAKAGACRKPPA